MSHKASNWLSELPPHLLTNGQFRVLFHLCDAHNSKRSPDEACFPSQARLIEVTGLSSSGLNKCLDIMETAGILRRKRTRKPNGTKGSTYYILGCDVDLTQEPTPLSGVPTNSTFDPSPTPLLPCDQLHPSGDKPVKEPVKEPVSGDTQHSFIERLLEESPRGGDFLRTLERVDWLEDNGHSKTDIMAAMQAYAQENKGNAGQFVRYAENLFKDDLWLRYIPKEKTDERKSMLADVARIKAHDRAKDGPMKFTPALAQMLIKAELITKAECQRVGIEL